MTGRDSRTPRRPGRLLAGTAAWLYLIVILAVVALLHWAGDSSWPMTLLTFSPRWVSLLPVVPLTACALFWDRRALWPLSLATFCAVGPIMGFCVPWRSLAESESATGMAIRVVTINVGNMEDRVDLMEFLRDAKADVIAFQEFSQSSLSPKDLGPDWHFASNGELLVASRFPIVDRAVSEIARGRWNPPVLRCGIQTPAGLIHVNCVHLYTLRKGLDAIRYGWWKGAPELKRVIAVRNEESEIASRFCDAQGVPALVLGDFNMTSDSAIFQRDWSRWQDAFASRGFGFGYTFGSRKIGLRIDHVLAETAHWSVASCEVGPDFRGQHRPLITDLFLRSDK